MKIFKFKKQNHNNGYSIIELLFYIALFAVLVLVVINAMLVMSRSFKESAIQGEILESGNVMERMTREIRQAYGISSITATTLRLNSTDQAGINKTIEFIFTGGNIQLWENGVLTGNLNTPNIVMTDVTFTEVTTTKGKAVKVVLSLRSSKDSQARIVSFYNTIVLRGDYE